MKHIHHHIFSMVGHLLNLMLLALLVAGCQQDYSIDTVSSAYSTAPKPDPGVTDEVVQLLSAIPGVSNITVQDSKLEERRGYYFFVEQLVDNTDASKGTFKQRCFLEYAGAEAPIMLYSHGYHIEDKIDNVLHHDIAQYLGANSLIVEHRYFGKSLPEDFNDTKFTYLYTSQASADLHRIVTLLKQHLFTKGNKWVCTGGSKSGGVATIYAYHSDLYGWDDIDLYMPFCAPFLTGTSESAGDKSVGTYLVNVCGSGYPEGSNEANAYQSLRAFPSAIANNKLLREACMRRFYQKDPESYIDIQDGKPNLTKIVIPGGCHSEKFLSPDSCPEEYSALIKQALDKYIKGSS